VLPGKQIFDLQLEDCWEGVWQATRLGWVDFGPNGARQRQFTPSRGAGAGRPGKARRGAAVTPRPTVTVRLRLAGCPTPRLARRLSPATPRPTVRSRRAARRRLTAASDSDRGPTGCRL
jgi:hypothetical protein